MYKFIFNMVRVGVAHLDYDYDICNSQTTILRGKEENQDPKACDSILIF